MKGPSTRKRAQPSTSTEALSPQQVIRLGNKTLTPEAARLVAQWNTELLLNAKRLEAGRPVLLESPSAATGTLQQAMAEFRNKGWKVWQTLAPHIGLVVEFGVSAEEFE